MSEPTNKSNRRSAQKAVRAGVENAFGGSNILLWTAVKAVSGAQARAAGRMTSKPFIPSLSQSIVETTDRKAGCGRSARPVWMGRDVTTRFLSISMLRNLFVTVLALALAGLTRLQINRILTYHPS